MLRDVTIACAVKVFDGMVLAADSATTMGLNNGSHQVWNNANKIIHLHRRKPLALMTWGLGQIGPGSVASLAKDLRRRFTGDDPAFKSWEIGDSWTVEEVADRVVEMFYDELYSKVFAGAGGQDLHLQLGLLIAGYSSGEQHGEAWRINLAPGGVRPAPQLVIPKEGSGWMTFAQPEASERLFNGIDSTALAQIQGVLPEEEFQKVLAVMPTWQRQAVVDAMPFGDAIEVARFMAETTARYSHFLLGPDTVGGVIDIAAINRHEGFRWVQRKHYYSAELNPWGHAK